MRARLRSVFASLRSVFAALARAKSLPIASKRAFNCAAFWQRLGEASPGEPSVFVLVQTRAFGDPLLSQAFEIIDSLRFD